MTIIDSTRPGIPSAATRGASILAALALLVVPPAKADQYASGLSAYAQFPVASTTATPLSNGGHATFDGQSIALLDATGAVQQTTVVLPTATFPSFLVLQPDGATLLLGESTNGNIYEYALPSGPLTLLATAAFNYDACVSPNGAWAVVSAATCGFGCGNTLLKVDLATGASTVLGVVSGPSGPVAFDVDGDLLYGLQSPFFPAPPGSFDVVRWPAALLAAGTPLGDANAQVLVPALDGCSDLVVDARSRDLVVVESIYGGTSKVRLHRGDGLFKAILASSADYLGGVGLATAATPAAQGAFQPFAPTGSRYTYSATDFVVSRLVVLAPVRPQLSASGPGLTGPGQASFAIAGGEPLGRALLVACTQANWSPTPTIVDLPLYQLHSGLPFGSGQVRRSGLVQLDAAGSGTRVFTNPGSSAPGFVLQALLVDGQNQVVGGSNEFPW
ncbi:MAG: hypothetical protein RL112_831 [Planctomycetota bacterium]